MGQFISIMKGNKVTDLSAASMQASLKSSSDSDVLAKYLKYLNDSGYILVKVNIINMNKLAINVWNKTKFPNMPQNELSKFPDEIKDFKKKIEYSSNGVSRDAGFALLFLGMASLSGIFSIAMPAGTIQEEVPYDEKKPYTIKYNEKDPTVTVVIPKIFITNKSQEFINFLIDSFRSALKQPDLPKPLDNNTIKQTVYLALEGFNRNTKNGEVRMANLINMLINLSFIFAIGGFFYRHDPDNTPKAVAELVSNIFASFPDDACYFNNDALVSFEPNICPIKKQGNSVQQKECPPEKVCPAEKECPAEKVCPPEKICPAVPPPASNTMFIILSIILGIIALLFIILYFTAKPKIIKVPLALSETDSV
jgi:hypothetical protein